MQFNCTQEMNILSETKEQVTVEMSKDLYKQLWAIYEKSFKSNDRHLQFKRRVVPLFLGKFYKWIKSEGPHSHYIYLEKIKQKKKTKQKKFELGDLKLMVRNDMIDIATRWQDFLMGPAEVYVKTCSKIQKNPRHLQRYLDSIITLLTELEKPFPYEKFLSPRETESYLSDNSKKGEQFESQNEDFYQSDWNQYFEST